MWSSQLRLFFSSTFSSRSPKRERYYVLIGQFSIGGPIIMSLSLGSSGALSSSWLHGWVHGLFWCTGHCYSTPLSNSNPVPTNCCNKLFFFALRTTSITSFLIFFLLLISLNQIVFSLFVSCSRLWYILARTRRLRSMTLRCIAHSAYCTAEQRMYRTRTLCGSLT